MSDSLRPHESQYARPPCGMINHSPRARHPGLRSQVGLRKITTNKARGGDGIPVELFQILEDDAVKVLHSICQQIWKTQQRPQDWKRSVFIPIPKKSNAKEWSNYHTVALISHSSKVMLKLLSLIPQKTVWFRSLRASQVALVVKNPSAKACDIEMRVRSLGWEDLLQKGMATDSSILAWKIPWTEGSGRLQSMGLPRVRHGWATVHACTKWIYTEMLLFLGFGGFHL